MNWEKYLELRREERGRRVRFRPENQHEAKQALALGIIDIGEYVEFSLTMEPLLDSAHDPDPDVRKEAIRKIAERRTPFSIQTLHRMLLDENEEVRLYSASELDRIEGEMQKQIYRLRERLEKHPGQEIYRFELAVSYIEYSRLLLRSKELRSFFLRKAIALLNINLKKRKQHRDYLFYRGWAYLLLDDFARAAADLKRVILLDKKFAQAFILLAEIYFRLGQLQVAQKIVTRAPIDTQQEDEYNVQLFWKN